jgi:putative ABC transport system permease protein
METFAQDVRFALRALRRIPAFTAVAIATLAVGIGANTAVFSILYAVLLRPLPFRDPGRIVSLNRVLRDGTPVGLSWPEFDDWRRTLSTFESMALYQGGAGDLVGGGGEPQRIVVASVSRGFFPLLAVSPVAGGTFDQEVLPADGLPPAVISESLWRDRFGARRQALGTTIHIKGHPYTVAGVMPRTMNFPWNPQAWIPLDGTQKESSRTARKYHVIGRMKPGVDARAALAQLRAVAAADARANHDQTVSGATMVPLREELTGSAMRVTLWLLFALVGFVLLIACANTATLLLSRERARAGEVAMRTALGATPGRIMRQLLTESVVLALFGTAAGSVIAVLGARAMLRYRPVQTMVGDAPLLSVTVLLFALAASLLTALLFGVAPALRLARGNLGTLTRQASSQRASRDLLRHHLVTAEVILSILLLVPAGLMTRSLLRLTGEPLGFDTHQLLVITADVPEALRKNWVGYYDQVLDHFSRLPGSKGVAASTDLPLNREKGRASIVAEGRSLEEANRLPASWQMVNETYFQTMGVPILRGRGFQTADRGGINVAVISRTTAQRYWPNRDPIGARIATPGLDDESETHFHAGAPDWITIVGIVDDVRSGAGTEIVPELYLPYFQHPSEPANLIIALRTPLPIAAVERPVKQAIHAISPVVPVRMRTYESMIDDRFAGAHLRSTLIRLFALLALILVAGGVYGVTSFWVEQRRREIGIRVALGAQTRDVVLLFVRRGMAAALIGVAIGAIGAVWLTRFVAPFLYKISPTDPLVFATAVAIALASVFVATALPAHRAATVTPADALRSE